MKASIIAANALFALGMATMHAAGHGRPAGETALPAPAATAARPSPCRDAVWPYIPAECGAPGLARPVRILPAELGR